MAARQALVGPDRGASGRLGGCGIWPEAPAHFGQLPERKPAPRCAARETKSASIHFGKKE